MSIFFGQLIGFIVSLIIFIKWIIPSLLTLIKKHQEDVSTIFAESTNAANKLANANDMYLNTTFNAKISSEKAIKYSLNNSRFILSKMFKQALFEMIYINLRNIKQLKFIGQNFTYNLELDFNRKLITQTEALIKAYISKPELQITTVDQFLKNLENIPVSMGKISPRTNTKVCTLNTNSLVNIINVFYLVIMDLDSVSLINLTNELIFTIHWLLKEPILSRHILNSSYDIPAKIELIDALISNKANYFTMSILREVALQRWSTKKQLLECIKHLALLSMIEYISLFGDFNEIKNQLFRFTYVLNNSPKLSTFLNEKNIPLNDKANLLDKLIRSLNFQKSKLIITLLINLISLIHYQSFNELIIYFTNLIVDYCEELVAHVTSAVKLTNTQLSRLCYTLTEIYCRQVVAQLYIEPKLLGGLSITIVDEIIDGSVLYQLATTTNQFPS